MKLQRNHDVTGQVKIIAMYETVPLQETKLIDLKR